VSRILITGIGAFSAIGDHVAANRQALIAGQSGIRTLSNFPSRYAGTLPCGEINSTTEDLKQTLGISDPGVTRTSLIALQALLEAVNDAGLTTEQLRSSDTALINASTVGGMCLTDELYHDANNDGLAGSPFLGSYDNASVTLFLSKQLSIGGIQNTINTACSSSANAVLYGARLLQHGLAKRVIVGGADSLAKFTINGFKALHILSANPCTPFDAQRTGLNLGEAGAYLVLEREEDSAHKKVYAQCAGYGNSNDSFHPSSISDDGEGPFLCMQRALEMAQLQPNDIDAINAHGTATENNDETESRAMIRLFATPPPFLSTKAYTGHTLGAAGALEAVFSILQLQHQEIYPALRFKEPIPSAGLIPSPAYRSMKVKHIMSNSFGFGGNCSSLIFSAI
jgi:3-oxoacyl-(acyl-carrier-protein) synthase